MPWVEAFTLLAVSHLLGDFVLQTEFQALNKRGGLGPDPVRRRALLTHLGTYGLALLPASAWIAREADPGPAVAALAIILVTHLIQDDGRLLHRYMRTVKGVDPQERPTLVIMVDQSLHVVVLLLAALIATA